MMKRKWHLLLIALIAMIVLGATAFGCRKTDEPGGASDIPIDDRVSSLTLVDEGGVTLFSIAESDLANTVKTYEVAGYPNVYLWKAVVKGSEGQVEVVVIRDSHLEIETVRGLMAKKITSLEIYPAKYYTSLIYDGEYKVVQGEVPMPIPPAKKNYRTFDGYWAMIDGKEVQLTAADGSFFREWSYTMQSLTLLPHFTLQEIKVAIDYNGDEYTGADALARRGDLKNGVSAPAKIKLGDSVDFLNVRIEREGFTFAGWYSGPFKIADERLSFYVGSDRLSESFDIHKDENGEDTVYLTARWKRNEYNIVFRKSVGEGESTIVATTSEKYGNPIPYGRARIDERYCSIVWKTSEGRVYREEDTVPADSLILIAYTEPHKKLLTIEDPELGTYTELVPIQDCDDAECCICKQMIEHTKSHEYEEEWRPCRDRICLRCGYVEKNNEPHKYDHAWACVDRTCTVCGELLIATEAHVLDETKFPSLECKTCGTDLLKGYGYYRQPNTMKLYFGAYPSEQLSDPPEELSALPTPDMAESAFVGWEAYDFGTDDEGFPNVWHCDYELNGVTYRGIYIHNGFRTGSDQYKNGVETGEVYWFKYTNITWTIREERDCRVTLISDDILDCGDLEYALLWLEAFTDYFGEGTKYIVKEGGVTLPEQAGTAKYTDYARVMGILIPDEGDPSYLTTSSTEEAPASTGIRPVLKIDLFPDATNSVTLLKGPGVEKIYYSIGNSSQFIELDNSASFEFATNTRVRYKGKAEYGYTMEKEMMTQVKTITSPGQTLEFKGTPLPVKITFDAAGGVGGPTELTTLFDSKLESITIPVRKCYHFSGYYVKLGDRMIRIVDEKGNFIANVGSDRVEDGVLIRGTYVKDGLLKTAEDLALVAVWEDAYYYVRYDANGGEGEMADKEFRYSQWDNLTDNAFVRTGYVFVGWRVGAGATEGTYANKAAVRQLIDTDGAVITLYAEWTPIRYNVSYFPGAETGVSGEMKGSVHTYDASSPLSANVFTRTGYTFAGWRDDKSDRIKFTDAEEVLNLTATKDATVKLYAVWEPIKYVVHYESNASGVEGSMPDTTYTYDERSTFAPLEFIRTGYVFLGWGTEAGATVKTYDDQGLVLNLTSVSDARITLYAVWTPVTYTIRYHESGDGETRDTSCTYDKEYTLTADFARAGERLVGWRRTLSEGQETTYVIGSEVKNLTTTDKAVVDLYAVWEVNTYTVIYDGNGATSGTVVSSAHTYNVAKTLTANAYARIGYTFLGWGAAADATEKAYDDQESVTNLTAVNGAEITLYAVWKPITYTVRYHESADGATQDASCTYDKEFPLTAAFVREGSHVERWNRALPDEQEETYAYGIAVKNLTVTDKEVIDLYAVWEVNAYTVIYDGNGATSGTVASSTHTYNVAQTLTANAYARIGYTFLGWGAAANATEKAYDDQESVTDLTTVNGAEITLYAVWKPITYTVSYDGNGGSGSMASTGAISYDVDWTLGANGFSKPGFIFAGWMNEANGAVYADRAMVRNLTAVDGGHVTLRAVWGSLLQYAENGGAYTVTAITEGADQLVDVFIPSEYEGKPVTAIASGAFENCVNITGITIPASVTAIGADAFKWNAKLETTTYTGTLSTWLAIDFGNADANPVSRSHSLRIGAIDVASGALTIPSDVTTIKDYAFAGASALTSVTIPNGVTTIGMAFVGCTGLESISLPFAGKSLTGAEEHESVFGYIFGYTVGAESTALSVTTAKNVSYYVARDAINNNVTTRYYKPYTYYVPATLRSVTFGAAIGSGAATRGVMRNVSDVTSVTIGTNVAAIPVNAFYGCTGLTSLTFASGSKLTTIGSNAFYGCSALTAAAIPTGVTSIGDYAFRGCSALTSTDLPTSVTTIGSYAFYSCSALTSVTIPASVTTIGDYAFQGCNKMATLTFTSGIALTTIGTGVFSNCSALTSLSIPASVTTIGSYAFNGCTKVTSVTIPASVTIIGANAFNGCTGLTTLTIPSNVTAIGARAFSGCTGLTTVTFATGSKLTVIDNYVFQGCTGLTSVMLPMGVTTIGDYAFSGDAKLTAVTLPSEITSIGASAFAGCSLLARVTFDGTSSRWSAATKGANWAQGAGAATAQGTYTMRYASDGLTYTLNGSEYTVFRGSFSGAELVIPSSYSGKPVTAISAEAFRNRTDLTSVEIPTSVTTIGAYAFQNCTTLTIVTIPASVTTINERAFQNCSKLTAVAIPASVTTIGTCAFQGCTGMTTLTFASGSRLTTIANSAFENCNKLTSVTIPSSVTSIGANAFYYCIGLTSLTFASGSRLTTIGNYAFNGCSKLTSVTIPASVTSIGTNPFRSCTALTTLTVDSGNATYRSAGNCVIETSTGALIAGCKASVIPSDGTVTSIGTYAFQNCTLLTSVTIPASVTTIGEYAFYGCTGMTSVTIPSSVTTIGSYAFNGCTGMTSLTFASGSKLTTIGSYAFQNCTKLTAVALPASVTGIGTNPFAYCSALTALTVESGNATYRSAGNCVIKVSTGELIAGCKSSVIPSDGTVTTINSYAFRGCTGLTSVTIPASVTSIGSYAFQGCTGMTSLTFASGSKLTTIANSAFENCNKLTSVTIPASVTSIGANAFYYCTGLTSLAFASGSSLTTINSYAFYNCSKLTTVTLPAGVTSIGNNAFYYCTGLTSVTIPSAVTTIGSYAFQNCTSLTDLYYDGTSTGWSAVSKASGWNSGAPVTVRYASAGLAYTLNGSEYTLSGVGSFSGTELVIPSSYSGKPVTAIAANAFREYGSLVSVRIPASVTSIGGCAFYARPSLTTITVDAGNSTYRSAGNSVIATATGTLIIGCNSSVIPNDGSVLVIGSDAFDCCTGLTSITIPASVTKIYDGAFGSCTALTTLTVAGGNATYRSAGNSVINISTGALVVGCKSSVIPSDGTVTSIGAYAFSGCTGLTSVTIPASVTTIGSNAFLDCTGLTSLTFASGSNLTTINGYAFRGCTGLTTVTIPSKVKTIGAYAFEGCSALTSLTFVAGCELETIGDYAFSACTKVTTVTLPSMVTTIGAYAFNGCTKVTAVTIPASVTTIGANAFAGCSALADVYYQGTSTSWDAVVKGTNWDGGASVVVHYATGELAYALNGNAYTVTGIGTFTATEVVIPSTYDGKPVTAIASGAFRGQTTLTTIVVPSSVTTIGADAFAGCSALTSITIPFLGSSAGVTASSTYQYPLGYLFGTTSYTGGTATSQSYYGSSTSSITTTTYYIPTSLRSVTVTGGEVLRGAFYNCRNLTSVTLPSSVTSIGAYAFYYCTGLTSVTIPANVTTIGTYAFYGCTGMTSLTFASGSKLTTIDNYAFQNCSKLTTVTLPSSVTTIGTYAFSGCSGLTSLTFASGSKLTTIGNYAFQNCSKLTTVTIPASVTSIGNNPFRSCTALTSLTVDSANATYRSAGNCVIKVSTGALVVGCKSSVIPSDGTVTTIGDYAFYGCTGMTSVTIPASVTSIGANAFYNCTGLTSLTFASGSKLTTIGNYAFENCTKLTTVTLPSGLTTINSDAFYYCTGLTTVTLPASVTSIGNNPFRSCTALTSLTVDSGNATYRSAGNCVIKVSTGALVVGCKSSVIPSDGTVTSIGTYAFRGCTGLTSVTIPASVTSIGTYAFQGCTGLTTLTFASGSSLTTIGGDAFSGCNKLTAVTVPANVTSIGSYAFHGCTGLTSLDFASGSRLTTINSDAFENCNKLTSVTLPASVTSIGSYAFARCSLLTDLCYEGTSSGWAAVTKGSNWNTDSPITVRYEGIASPSVDVGALTASGLWSSYTEYFSGGSGTDDDPYKIANARQLAFLAKIINDKKDARVLSGGSTVAYSTLRQAVYKLMADINLSAHYWIPIGNFNGTDNGFCGKFQGNGKIVAGMYVDDDQGTTIYNMGLFGCLDVRTSPSASNYSYITDLTVFGIITANADTHQSIGGIAGSADSYWTIRRCFSGVDIELKAGYSQSGRFNGVGGIIGSMYMDANSASGNAKHSDTVDDSVYVGTIYVKSGVAQQIGGICGQGYISQNGGFSIQRCLFSGWLDLDAASSVERVGTICGNVDALTDGSYAKMTECISAGDMSLPSSKSNYGVWGRWYGDNDSAKNNIAKSDIGNGDNFTFYGTVTCPSDGNRPAIISSVYSTEFMAPGGGSSYTCWSTSNWTFLQGDYPMPKANSFIATYATGSNTIPIYDGQQLRVLAETTDWFDGWRLHVKNYKLMNDIEVTGLSSKNEGFRSFGTDNPSDTDFPFKGTFDGNNKTIYVEKLQYLGSHGGLFGTIEDATIKNLTVSYNNDVTFTDKENGGVVGNAKGTCTIENVTVTSTSGAKLLKGTSRVGGIIGYFGGTRLTIKGCTVSKLRIETTGDCAGGIGGALYGTSCTIENCTVSDGTTGTGASSAANMTVKAGGNWAGGICGDLDTNGDGETTKNTDTLKGCTVRANVTAEGYGVGGLCGYNDHAISTSKYLKGFILAKTNTTRDGVTGIFAGGLVGDNRGTIVGEGTGTVSAYGMVRGNADGQGLVGGIAGYSKGLIDNICSKMLVGAQVVTSLTAYRGNYVGGIVGYTTVDIGSCTYNNSTGVYGASYVGGLVGYSSASIFNYNDSTYTNTGTVNASGDYVGGLIGYAAGTVCYVNQGTLTTTMANSGNVTGASYVGGLIGRAVGVVGEQSYSGHTGTNYFYNSGNVTGSGNYVGGISGYCAQFARCAAEIYNGWDGTGTQPSARVSDKGTVKGQDYVGGVHGYITGVFCPRTLINYGAATEGRYYVGGILGLRQSEWQHGGTNYSNVTGTAIVGGNYGWSNNGTTIRSSLTNYGSVQATGSVYLDFDNSTVGSYKTSSTSGYDIGSYVGGNVGNWIGNLNESYHLQNYGSVTGASSYVGGNFGFVAGSINNVQLTCGSSSNVNGIEIKQTGGSCVGGNIGKITGSVNITNARAITNYARVTGQQWVGGCIGYASGQIGMSSTASGTYYHQNYGTVSATTERCGGIIGGAFGSVYSCRNSGSVTSATFQAGGICARFDTGTIANCKNTGSVVAITYEVGGIIGYNNAGGISNCTNTGNVESKGADSDGSRAGGIVGKQAGSAAISDCTNSGQVKTFGDYCGGIAGWVYGTSPIQGTTTNTGKIIGGGNYVGGIVGRSYGAIGALGSPVVNNGDIRGTSYVGGIVGQNTANISYATNNGRVDYDPSAGEFEFGGITGGVRGECTIDHCSNTGRINAPTRKQVGGICGYSANAITISNTESIGSIVGAHQVGGIIGWQNGGALTLRTVSYRAGTVNGTTATGDVGTGGIIGRLTGSLTGSGVTMTGTVYAPAASCVGGIIGYSTKPVSGFTNGGSVTGGYCVGGIVGYLNGSDITITACTNGASGNVNGITIEATGTGTPPTNGDSKTGAFVGGIVGRFRSDGSGALTGCTNYAKVKATADSADTKCIGGIVGETYISNKLAGCTNQGTVGDPSKKAYDVGGIVGHCTTQLAIQCEAGTTRNTGAVYGTENVGGIIGSSNAQRIAAAMTMDSGSSATSGRTYYRDYNGKGDYVLYTGSYAANTYYYATGNANMVVSNSGNVTATGSYVGGIVGRMSRGILGVGASSITNIGNVAGGSYVGGICGKVTNEDGDRYPSRVEGTIVNGDGNNRGAVSGVDYVGGIVGQYICDAVMTGVTNTGSITGRSSVGGIVGNMQSAGGIRGPVNSGTVTSTDTRNNYSNENERRGGFGRVGGIVGGITSRRGGTISDAENHAPVTVMDSINAGGIAGYCGQDYTLSDCRNTGEIRAIAVLGGIIGDAQGNLTITSCTNVGAVRATGISKPYTDHGEGAYAGGIVGHMNLNPESDKAPAIGGTVANSGNVTNSGIGSYVGGIAGYWGPIVGFGGTVTNSGAVTSAGDYVGGIVGYAVGDIGNDPTSVVTNGSSGSLNHPTIGRVSGRSYVGGIVGRTTGVVGYSGVSSENYRVRNYGAISNTGRNVAGIAAYLTQNSGKGVYGAANYGNVSGSSSASGQEYWQTAGIVGKADAANTTIKYCRNDGSITSLYGDNGGIVGHLKGSGNIIDQCKNNGSVTGRGITGGVVGSIANSATCTIRNCRNSGAVTATGSLGASGDNIPAGANVGGILGATAAIGVTIANGENTGRVQGNNPYVGGIVGYYKGTITGCTNSGAVTGVDTVGGIAGYASGALTDCTNTGTVTAGTSALYVDGIVGRNDGATITNCVDE